MRPVQESSVALCIAMAALFAGAFAPVLYLGVRALAALPWPWALSPLLSEAGRQWTLLKTTAIVSLGTALGAILVGAPLAFLLNRVSFPGRFWFQLLFILPLLIPPYIHTICWIDLLGPGGWTARHLPGLFPYLPNIYGCFGTIWVMVLSYYPLVTLVAYVGFSRTDADLEDAARLQAGRWRSRFGLSWRLAQPAVLTGALFTLIFALSNFGVPSLLRVRVYSLEVFYRLSVVQQMDQAVFYAIPLLLFSFGALMAINHLEKDPRFIVSGSGRRAATLNPGGWGGLASAYAGTLLAASVVLPLVVLFRMTGSWENFRAAVANARTDILVSFWSAVIAACAAVAIGAVMAFAVRGMSRRAGHMLELVCLLSFAFPAAVVGIGIIGLWNRGWPFQWVYSSFLILAVAYFCRYISFAFKPVLVAAQYLDPGIDESARIGGVPWHRRVWRLQAPLSANGLKVAWFLVYLFALTDLDTAILVYPPGRGTVPVRIFNLLHFGRQEWVGALCLLLVGLTIIFYLVLMLWGTEKTNATSGSLRSY